MKTLAVLMVLAAWYPSPGAIREGKPWDGRSCTNWCQFLCEHKPRSCPIKKGNDDQYWEKNWFSYQKVIK